MPRVLRPIGHDDRLSIVDHLDELRSRLIVCGISLAVAFGICFWQNHPLLRVLNKPLPTSVKSANHIAGLTHANVTEGDYLRRAARSLDGLAHVASFPAAARANLHQVANDLTGAAQSLPHTTPKQLPITIGIGEPFTITVTVAAYFALLITLPVLLYQLYAFVIPALHPHEQRVARPVMVAAPALFIAGVVFTYFLVLPPAVHFLQGYNSRDFDILVQARSIYRFEVLTMAGIGLAFEVPLFLLALQRAGVINSSTLTGNWRYAVVIIAVIVAALPGVDPVTMALEMFPLVLLYFASIVLLKIVDRRDAARTARDLAQAGDGLDSV
jgi:sec-independent protein translocase protein TatC